MGTGNGSVRFGRAFAVRDGSGDADGSGAPSHRLLAGTALVLLAALALALALAPRASAAVAPKAVTGYFGATGAAGGQLNTPRGTAVNQANGNVYVAEQNNQRVSVFNSSGTFLRAFGQDVVESGPGNNGTGFEICVAANGDVCKIGITTASTGGAMQAPQGVALDAAGNVYVSESTKLRVQKFDPNGNFLLAFGQDVVESGPGNVPATSAVQTLTVTADGGKYKLKFGGKETAELAFNATAAQIQTALTGLSSIGAGNVTVTGTGPYTITFAGALANNFEPLITTESGPGEPLTNGLATVVNTTTGSSGFETCVAGADVCKIGVTAETGGAFRSAFTGYVAVAPVGAPNAGNVLVADPLNLRVQEFTPGGGFVRAFGFDVVRAGPDNTGTAFEVCQAAAGDACKVGLTGTGVGQFANTINRVAEDAEGNIYTIESGTPNFRVQKFTLPGNVVTPQGNFAQAITKGTAATNAPSDVAIDPATKNVLVTKLFAAGATPSCPNTGVASVLERRVLELSPAGALEGTHMTCAGISIANGLAMRSSASTGDVYVSSTTGESRLYVLNVPTPPTVGFSGVSNITAHSATVSGFVNPNPTALPPYALTTGYHVSYKRTIDSTFSVWPGEDVNLGRGSSNVVVTQNLQGLEANTTYEVQIVATKSGFNGGSASTAIFTFTTPAAKPLVSIPTAVTASTGGDARAVLSGTVSPNSQATTYRFEYGTSDSYGSSIPVPNGSAGSGGVAVPVNQSLTGLLPSTTYHFRLVATNPQGTTISPDRTFTTPAAQNSSASCPNEQLRVENNSTALPSCRALELVTPADKKPQGIVRKQFPGGSLDFQLADDGQSFVFPLLGGLEDGTASGDTNYRAARADSGWQSTQITPPSLVTAPEVSVLGGATPGELVYNSPNLSCSVVLTFNPLTADVPAASQAYELRNYYVRDNTTGSFRLVTNTFPSNPGIPPDNGAGLKPFTIFGAAEDCSRVYFSSKYEYIAGASGFYEWDDGTLRDAGRLPNGSVPPGQPGVGSQPALNEFFKLRNENLNPVSRDGSRFFFTAPSEPGGFAPSQVFARLDGGTVVEVSRKQGGAQNSLGARYETASPDGSHVFFLGNYGLTAQSSVGAAENCTVASLGAIRNCDLYDYDVDTGVLTNLSADPNPADPRGAVAQGVVAVSEDGSSVYFAARGQLIPGQGKTYAENVSGGGSANIYLSRNGQLSYVANITATTGSDGDLGTNLVNGLGLAETTPDGDHLLFASTANITGYDSGGRREGFRYGAETGATQCISCRLDGLPTVPFTIEGGFGVRTEAGRMTDDGERIFFARPDVLAPGAVDGNNNIYEWNQGQIHLLASGLIDPMGLAPSRGDRFFGISRSGNEVFFTTSTSLIPHDTDFAKDVYVARVNGGFAVPPTPPSCDPAADQCQGAATDQPGTSSPASGDFSGPGNPPVASGKPKCPKGKVRKKGKCVKKKSARKKHGNKQGHDRSTSANHGGVK